MKTILVTGGAGFIGSNFIIHMMNKYRDYFVINLDKLTYAGKLENLAGIDTFQRYSFIQGDICDSALVTDIFESYNIDYIVNFAAESHVDRSIAEPEVFIRTNVLGTANLIDAAKHFWLDNINKSDPVNDQITSTGSNKFLQVSTDEVYGSLGETGYFTETTPLDPHSPYSASKAGADLIVKAYFDTFGMPVNITRCSNNYGPRQFPEKLIPLMISNAYNKKPLPVYGDGLNIRDWLHVDDHCRALDLVLHQGRSGEIYNIGGNNEITNIELVKEIIRYMHTNIDEATDESLISYVEDRRGHDRRYGIDAGKIRRQLGWVPLMPFEEGLGQTIRWYIDNKMNNVTVPLL